MTRAMVAILALTALASCGEATQSPAPTASIEPRTSASESSPTAEAAPSPEAAPQAVADAQPSSEGAARLVSKEELRDMLVAAGPKPRVYNFWATWCGPCIAELPALKAFAKEHPEVELVLVSVDMPAVRETHVLPFLKRFELLGLTSVQLDARDPASALIEAVPGWPDSVPVTLFVRADGTRARQFNGAVGPADLQAGLQAAIE